MTDPFEMERGRLTAVAYSITGSVMEAEDVVQDAYLRWTTVERTAVENPAAYLTTVVTRLAIDRLRSARARRETYVGPWLPEPIVTELGDDPADVVAEAEQLSLAFLTALERLNPIERAVFVLRTVFDADYSDIGDFVDRSPQACRQIASRARQRVSDPQRSHRTGDETELLTAFMTSLMSGDETGLRELLSADVVSWSDGGPERRAARHPIMGQDRVVRFLLGLVRQGAEIGGWLRPAKVNGGPGYVVMTAEGPYGVMSLDTSAGEIATIRIVINPDKVAHIRG